MTTNTTTTFEQYRGSPAELYEQYFVPAIGEPFAVPVVEAAELRAGERVLDVACGTGVVACLAAERVGATGTVAGVDGNADMLAVARSSTPAEAGVEWHEASADGLPFPDDSFDAALCSLGLQFFADKRAALAEMHRVLVTDGRATIGVPGPTPPLFAVLHDVLEQHLGPDIAAFVDAVFSFHDEGRLRKLFTTTGFDEPLIRASKVPVRLAAPADFFWQYMLGTPLAPAVRRLGAEARGRLEADIVRRWQPFVDDGGLHPEIRLHVATARTVEAGGSGQVVTTP